jgi:hypothetical protein
MIYPKSQKLVEVEAWGDAHAPTVAEAAAVEQEELGLTAAEVLARVQAEVVVLALGRAAERASADVSAPLTYKQVESALVRMSPPCPEAGALAVAGSAEGLSPFGYAQAVALSTRAGPTEALSSLRYAQAMGVPLPPSFIFARAAVQGQDVARAWAQELAELHKATRVWMQVLAPAPAQAWLRLSAQEACRVEAGCGLWPQHRQDYWWLVQIITPIIRLPPELLQQIFLVIIDSVNDSPLVLMRVCKYWYNIITGIWASIKLGTSTSKNAITRKLERKQWLLDVQVDTKIDRGHFTAPEGAYQGIFAAMEATSRW